MRTDTTLLWWSLGVLTFRRYEALLKRFGSLDAAIPAIDALLLSQLGMRNDTIRTVLENIRRFDADRVRAEMHEHGVELVSIEDDTYPRLLREIADPPVFLSYRGDFSVLSHPCLAVVGTRRMTQYGRRVAETFVMNIAQAGVITVSGLALGVDAAVARDTLNARGRTVAVLGHGLCTIHPRANLLLSQKIIAGGGLLLSEYPLDYPPDIYTFPARNRIIAGLSLATLVIEAPRDSGAIITAELALEYNRDVFAVPGEIFTESSGGCNALIAQARAKLITSPRELLTDIGIAVREDEVFQPFKPHTHDETVVYNVLNRMPQTIDQLVLRTGLTPSAIGVALTMMELSGGVQNLGGGQWVRR